MLAGRARRKASNTSTGEEKALMRQTHLALSLFLLGMLSIALPATAQELADGAAVRIQSSQLNPGWHEGKVHITKEGCALVWKPAPEVSGGRLGLGLMFIQKLERKDGAKWIELPVAPMMKKEPKTCQEGAG